MAARTDITINEIPFQGNVAEVTTAADATNGMQVDNDGNTLLRVENGDVAAKQVTVVSVDDPFGRQEDIVKSIAAGDSELIGPLIPSIWNQPGRKCFVDFDADTSVTVSAIRYNPRR